MLRVSAYSLGNGAGSFDSRHEFNSSTRTGSGASGITSILFSRFLSESAEINSIRLNSDTVMIRAARAAAERMNRGNNNRRLIPKRFPKALKFASWMVTTDGQGTKSGET